jgi:hypothetical protein
MDNLEIEKLLWQVDSGLNDINKIVTKANNGIKEDLLGLYIHLLNERRKYNEPTTNTKS